uniref:Calcium-transporting P-type ATPase N-terminal autoinhibitory domain-containing protein n=1 Tax=Fagus sylvatica TaxID=28930 RepID=A0A2N9F2L8_FAGSY
MASRGSTSSANGLLPSGSSNNNINNNHHVHDDHDEEAGPGSVKSYSDDEISSYDPFDIQTKNASLETLKRWRWVGSVARRSLIAVRIVIQCHTKGTLEIVYLNNPD